MSQISKAQDLYLRGFPSRYIKRRTGVSTQSLLKTLAATGVKFSKYDIRSYQIEFIKSHFDNETIKAEYRRVAAEASDLYKECHAKRIEALSCGFGDLAYVMKALIGENSYKMLRNECWQTKMTATVQSRYGVSNVFQKEAFDVFVSNEAVQEGRVKRRETLIERYGVESPNANDEIKAKMIQTKHDTMISRYGVSNPMQIPDVAIKSAKTRQQTMTERYGASNSVQVDAIREKIFDARRNNGTLNSSNPEDALYEMLVNAFGVYDVKRNIKVDSRYPYHVDFYIPSRDMFIELNGDRAHNTHWYDPHNTHWYDPICVSDQQTVHAWTENMSRLEAQSNRPSRYRKYIHTWTVSDVAKRKAARKHQLNYVVFWDGSSAKRGGKLIPNLADAKKWFAAGCPNASDYEHSVELR